jgi:hypothetical protein
MSFFKKLFGGKAEVKAEPVKPAAHGVAPLQTKEEVDATRLRMEAEMVKQQQERGARAADKPS